jgi:hypothetical protein
MYEGEISALRDSIEILKRVIFLFIIEKSRINRINK